MAKYINAFIIPVPKKSLKAYETMAKKSAKIWRKCGALEYVETIGDDVPKGKTTSFPRSVKLKGGEKVVVGYTVFKSKAHADKVMAKVMNDKEIRKMWDNMPFDGMRMVFGGFKTLVSA